MNAGMFFLIVSAIYFAPHTSKESGMMYGWINLALAVVFTIHLAWQQL